MNTLTYCVLALFTLALLSCSPDKSVDVIKETYTITSPDENIHWMKAGQRAQLIFGQPQLMWIWWN